MDKNKSNKKAEKVVNSAVKARNFSIFLYIQLGAAVVLSLFSLSFHADISLVAFPVAVIYTGITAFFCIRTLVTKNSKLIPLILRLVEYLPFVLLFCFVIRRAGEYGTPFWYDIVTVICWWIVFIFSFVLANCMAEKNIKVITEKWTVPYEKPPKRHGFSWVLFETLDWIDNLVQAVFTVLIFQIFILQLYVIPSESMVPTFLIKDRVMVTKLTSGPKFPLTDIGLPVITKYKRGNVVVVRNPHYKIDRKSEIKTVTSQLVNMLSFMTINLNTDEYGNLKADPLVKRVCGVPGEQLVMQDGTLYRRTRDSDVFTPVEEDAKFACWDLSKVNKTILSKIETYPLASLQPNKTASNLTSVMSRVFKVKIQLSPEAAEHRRQMMAAQNAQMNAQHNDAQQFGAAIAANTAERSAQSTFSGDAARRQAASGAMLTRTQSANATVRRTMPKVGRNDPCPCGSGKKYKQCCGR